jgi:hypothetical protein
MLGFSLSHSCLECKFYNAPFLKYWNRYMTGLFTLPVRSKDEYQY